MSASAHHLKGFIPVLEEKEGAPLGDVAGPKFAHGIQIPLIEGIIESLHPKRTTNAEKNALETTKAALA